MRYLLLLLLLLRAVCCCSARLWMGNSSDRSIPVTPISRSRRSFQARCCGDTLLMLVSLRRTPRGQRSLTLCVATLLSGQPRLFCWDSWVRIHLSRSRCRVITIGWRSISRRCNILVADMGGCGLPSPGRQGHCFQAIESFKVVILESNKGVSIVKCILHLAKRVGTFKEWRSICSVLSHRRHPFPGVR
jgi:hypothetical protein